MTVAVFVNYHLEGQQEGSESCCTTTLVKKQVPSGIVLYKIFKQSVASEFLCGNTRLSCVFVSSVFF